MKKIITIILFLMPLFLMAQTAPPIVQGSKYYEFRNGLRVDSAFFIPRKDTLFFDNTLKAPGMITWRPADSTFYLYRGNRWLSIVSSAGTGISLDSVRRSNDTLFFRYTTGGELAVAIPPGNLQQVTDIGNVTTNEIVLTGADSIRDVNGLHLLTNTLWSGNLYQGTKDYLTMQMSDFVLGATGQSNYSAHNMLFTSDSLIRLQGGKGLVFYTSDGVTPATFNTRVNGVNAIFSNEFLTRYQGDSTAADIHNSLIDSLAAQTLQIVTNKGNTTTNSVMIGSSSQPSKKLHITGSSLTSDTAFVGDPTNTTVTPALVHHRNIAGNLVSVVTRQSSGYITAPGRSLITYPYFATGISTGNPAISYVWSHNIGAGSADVTFRSGTSKGVWIGPDTLTNSVLKLYAYTPAYGTSANILTVKDSTQTQFLWNLTVKNNRPRLAFRDSTSDYELHVPDSAHLRKALIGDTIPLTALFPWYDLTVTGGLMMLYSNGSSNPTFESRRFNGTFNAPTTILKGQSIMGLMASPFNGTAFGTKASVAMFASEDHTASTAGTYIALQTTNKGTITRRNVAIVTDSGHIMIGNLSTGASAVFNSSFPYDSSIASLDIIRPVDTSSHLSIAVRGKLAGSGIYMKRTTFSVTDAGNAYASGLEIGLSGTSKYDTYYRDSATNRLVRLPAGPFGQFYQAGPGGKPQWVLPGFGSGTVISVALSLPSIFSVSGSPVTASGTLTATLTTQTANTIFAGPSSGGAAAPAFRTLIATDIPNLDASKITTGSFPNIYNTSSFLSANRSLGGKNNAYGLAFDSLAYLLQASRSLTSDTTSQVSIVPGQTEVGSYRVTGSRTSTMKTSILPGNYAISIYNGSPTGVYLDSINNIGLGNVAPSNKVHITGSLRIQDGNPGSGKVWTDTTGTGVGAWRTPSAGSTPTLDQVLIAGNTSTQNIGSVQSITTTGTSNFNSNIVVGGIGSFGIGVKTDTLNATGSVMLAIRTVTGNTTLNASDHTIIVNNSGSATITLPAVTSAVHRVYVIKKISGALNNVVIDPNGAELIDGTSTETLTLQYSSVIIQCDGLAWYVTSAIAGGMSL